MKKTSVLAFVDWEDGKPRVGVFTYFKKVYGSRTDLAEELTTKGGGGQCLRILVSEHGCGWSVRRPSRPRTSHDSLPSSSFSLNTIGLLHDLLPLLVTLLYSETFAVHVGIPEEILCKGLWKQI
jgi:hypothetical protein